MIVVKVGGSLFDHPNLGPGLSAYIATLSPAPILLVAGGGKGTDAVRELDRVHHLGEDIAHELALQSMVVSAYFLKGLLRRYSPNVPFEVLNPLAFALQDETHPQRLPHSWAVTSDSIAARVAVFGGADRLVLLKSVDIPAHLTWEEAARQRLVDEAFPLVVKDADFDITAINFRQRLDHSLAEQR